jgi:hypothetical protein
MVADIRHATKTHWIVFFIISVASCLEPLTDRQICPMPLPVAQEQYILGSQGYTRPSISQHGKPAAEKNNYGQHGELSLNTP